MAWMPSGEECAIARSAVLAHGGCGAVGRGVEWRARAGCQSVCETIGATWEPVCMCSQGADAQEREEVGVQQAQGRAPPIRLPLRGQIDTACAT